MKLLRYALALSIVAIACQASDDKPRTSADMRQWMAALPDTLPLHRVSMAGTHNSGTATATRLFGMGQCQSRSIAEQLADGIRFVDIRIDNNDALTIGHGPITTELRLADVLTAIVQHLSAHPSEFVIMLLEANSGHRWDEAMRRRVSALMQMPAVADRIEDQWPTTVGEARGNIIVIRRSAACPVGEFVPWQNNRTFVSGRFSIEDCYDCTDGVPQKRSLVSAHLDAARADTSARVYLTYASIAYTASRPLTSPKRYAAAINPWLGAYIDRCTRPARIGVLLMDFYEASIVERIVACNEL